LTRVPQFELSPVRYLSCYPQLAMQAHDFIMS
jgi:hypothetical protein